MHCVTQKLPIKYLGLPLGANPRRTKTWQNVVDKVKSRLALWKRKLLSFAGRLTLVKSVMDSLPGYYISIFKLPKGIAKEIDKLKAAFLWGSSELRRKIHMVKWTDVTLSKDKGGLGIRKAKESNDCLLLKWWWRYGVEDESLWKRVIVSKYGADGGRWLPLQNGEGKESVVWSDILSVAALNPELFQFFASKLQIVVGNGSRILFWHDRWCMNLKLKEEFPRLFRLSMEKEEKLSYFMQRRDRDGPWSLQFRRPLFSWEEEEVGKLQELTKDVPRLNENLCDGVKWTASASGVFTVASVRSWLQKNSGTSLQVPKMLWNNLAPPKAQFLCWLAWRGRVKVAVVLQRLGVLGGNANVACPFCLAAEESVDHLFVQCPQIWKVWGKLLQWWNLCWVSPATVDGVFSWWLGTKHRKLVKKIWMLVPVAMLWSTWRLRNEIVFKGHLPDMLELGEVVKVRVGYWVRASLPSVTYSVHHIVENLSQVLAMKGVRLGMRKGAWTREEDLLLRNCIQKYGEGVWHQVPLRAGLNRCRKSCRLRWLNYLKPNIKRGNFTFDEVDLIIKLHKLLGNRWSLIAGRLPGRTPNDVKNFWNTHMHKKMIAQREEERAKAHKKPMKYNNIIKPQPRTFSRNLLFPRGKSFNTENIQTEGNFPKAPPASLLGDCGAPPWLDGGVLDSMEMNSEISWSMYGSADQEPFQVPWLPEELTTSMLAASDNSAEGGQSDWIDNLTCNLDLWDFLK
ncbi:unnamed protein product [Camellia sinensis]